MGQALINQFEFGIFRLFSFIDDFLDFRHFVDRRSESLGLQMKAEIDSNTHTRADALYVIRTSPKKVMFVRFFEDHGDAQKGWADSKSAHWF